jgi:putative spermidine/putrescine transport system substrate-binding protein
MALLARISRLAGVLGAVAVMAFVAGCGSDDKKSSTGAAASTTTGEASAEPVKLTIGAWGGTIDKATKKYYTEPYTAETKNTFVYDDAPAAQLARIKAQNKAGKVTWDVVDSAGSDNAWPLHAAGLLAPLPADLKAKLVAELGEGKVTDFGFSHANIGHTITCNMDKVKVCPKNMAEFFDVKKFPGSRMFPGIGSITVAAMAQSALGISPADITSKVPDVDAVFKKLEEVKPAVKVFFTSGDQQEQVMRSGEADMGIMWSGRAYALKAQKMNVEINWEGGVYEPSYWAVVKGSPNEAAGFKFLEAIAKNIKGQAGWANDLHYSVPNPKALATLPQNIQDELADTPSNFDKIVTPNYAWYAENNKALDSRFQDYVKG